MWLDLSRRPHLTFVVYADSFVCRLKDRIIPSIEDLWFSEVILRMKAISQRLFLVADFYMNLPATNVPVSALS